MRSVSEPAVEHDDGPCIIVGSVAVAVGVNVGVNVGVELVVGTTVNVSVGVDVGISVATEAELPDATAEIARTAATSRRDSWMRMPAPPIALDSPIVALGERVGRPYTHLTSIHDCGLGLARRAAMQGGR
jgi:hypothetical protein